MSVEKLAEKKWVKRLWLDIEIKQIKPEYSIQYTPEGRRAMLLSLDTVKKLIDCDVDETLCEIARIERG